MTSYDEADHPRHNDGKWAAKQLDEIDPGFGMEAEPFDEREAATTWVDEKPTRSRDPFPEGAVLQHFRVVGFDRRMFRAANDAPAQPGGTCWHCGAAIVNCVIVEHADTGQRETIGTDCAERVGLDRQGIRRLMNERYAEARAAHRAEISEQERQATATYGPHGTEARYSDGGCRCSECVAANEHGEHGTPERYESGCRCVECCVHAPHGSIERFRIDDCLCPECVPVAVAEAGCEVESQTFLVDADTGRVIEEARLVNTRYGMSWVIDDPDGDDPTWVSAAPKRRATMVKKGFLEGRAPALVKRGRNGTYTFGRTADPMIDRWGEPLPGVDTATPEYEEAALRHEAANVLEDAHWLPQAEWDALSGHTNSHVRRAVAGSGQTTRDTLIALTNDPDLAVAASAKKTLSDLS